MVKLTLLARVADGLPLAEGLDGSPELEFYKSQAKVLFKKMSSNSSTHNAYTNQGAVGNGGQVPSRMSYESGPMIFHYIVEHGVCYLTVTDRAYPKKLAYQYLNELQFAFDSEYRDQVDTASRPYAFVRFDTVIQRTKKLYLDSRTQRNLDKLNEDLADVHMVMTKNINDVLGQGEKLDHISRMTGDLASESKKYHNKARDLSRQALIKKYAPMAFVCVVILFVFIIRHYFYSR